jgi:hypothetical protein
MPSESKVGVGSFELTARNRIVLFNPGEHAHGEFKRWPWRPR